MKASRRDLLKHTLTASAALIGVSSLAKAQYGAQCLNGKTPKQPEGPFYPIVDQLDKDNDLINIRGSQKIAKGQVILVQGVVTDQNCQAVPGVLVEIWQACHTGKYNHAGDPNPAALDPDFQYWGKAVTNERGEYRFRTIVPGAYPAGDGWIRPPHIHFKVSKRGYLELITQMYFAGHDLNMKDFYIQRLSKADREKIIIPLRHVQQLPHPVGNFNIQIERLGR